ncbi:hypothetical protein [Halorubrum distributum]|uniref:hypothetical protein n=1 Tax=Halorubrum distributum TaxID=29283 RepID=UPI001EF9DA6C|nr:hypothetical protein [Halorubrum terrestre]
MGDHEQADILLWEQGKLSGKLRDATTVTDDPSIAARSIEETERHAVDPFVRCEPLPVHRVDRILREDPLAVNDAIV